MNYKTLEETINKSRIFSASDNSPDVLDICLYMEDNHIPPELANVPSVCDALGIYIDHHSRQELLGEI